MSDLSWLNPTPHAIAVYASQPLSPVATQHSLPSGRYSLLGPDFTSTGWIAPALPGALIRSPGRRAWRSSYVCTAQRHVISPLPVAFVEGGGRRDIGWCLPGTAYSLSAREAKVLHQVNRVVI